ncbi:MAG: hypothetical protein BZY81_04125 [SAR202 cluster bacterium Io17-Chloro-G4]|nr:MAG: hypothetical protein BZY81_04125 [SAR202 cluster bacterium Io17-Chloro-G4]
MARLIDTPLVDASLMEVAREIGPVLRQESNGSESQRRLTQGAVDALSSGGLLTMLTSKSMGGQEVNPITYASVVEEISRSDPSSGWSLVNPLLWAFLCSRLPDQGADELLGNDPRAWFTAAIAPPLTAVPVDGGYIVSGRGLFASNCHHAAWFAAVCEVKPGQDRNGKAADATKPIWVYVAAQDCRILDTWHVLGLRGTGSDDFEVENAFVPHHRAFPLTTEFVAGSNFQGPLYQFSLMGMITAALPSVMLGIARTAIDEVATLAEIKTPAGNSSSLRSRPSAHSSIAQAEAAYRSGRALLYETLIRIWESTLAGNQISWSDRSDIVLAATNAALQSAHATELMYRLAGTAGIYQHQRLERFFRDMQVARQHRFYTEARYETFGQMYFGLQPDYSLTLL